MGNILRLKITKILSVLILFGLSIWILWPFSAALSLGAVIALSLAPIQEKFVARVRCPRWIAAGGLVFMTMAFLLVPLVLVGYQLWQKISSGRPADGFAIVNRFSDLVAAIAQKASQITGVSIHASDVAAHLRGYGDQLFSILSAAVTNIPAVALQIVVALGILWYLLVRFGPRLIFDGPRHGYSPHWWRFLKTAQQSSQSVLFATVLVGFLQSGIVALSAGLMTDLSPAFVFTGTLFVSFIPVIGAGPACAAVALYEYFNGDHTGGLILLGIAVFVGVIDNILRAFVAARVSHSSSGINFLGVVGGIIVWGLPGLILGPIILELAMSYFTRRPAAFGKVAPEDLKTPVEGGKVPKRSVPVVHDPWGFEVAR